MEIADGRCGGVPEHESSAGNQRAAMNSSNLWRRPRAIGSARGGRESQWKTVTLAEVLRVCGDTQLGGFSADELVGPLPNHPPVQLTVSGPPVIVSNNEQLGDRRSQQKAQVQQDGGPEKDVAAGGSKAATAGAAMDAILLQDDLFVLQRYVGHLNRWGFRITIRDNGWWVASSNLLCALVHNCWLHLHNRVPMLAEAELGSYPLRAGQPASRAKLIQWVIDHIVMLKKQRSSGDNVSAGASLSTNTDDCSSVFADGSFDISSDEDTVGADLRASSPGFPTGPHADDDSRVSLSMASMLDRRATSPLVMRSRLSGNVVRQLRDKRAQSRAEKAVDKVMNLDSTDIEALSSRKVDSRFAAVIGTLGYETWEQEQLKAMSVDEKRGFLLRYPKISAQIAEASETGIDPPVFSKDLSDSAKRLKAELRSIFSDDASRDERTIKYYIVGSILIAAYSFIVRWSSGDLAIVIVICACLVFCAGVRDRRKLITFAAKRKARRAARQQKRKLLPAWLGGTHPDEND